MELRAAIETLPLHTTAILTHCVNCAKRSSGLSPHVLRSLEPPYPVPQPPSFPGRPHLATFRLGFSQRFMAAPARGQDLPAPGCGVVGVGAEDGSGEAARGATATEHAGGHEAF